jgi:hypothetical protein
MVNNYKITTFSPYPQIDGTISDNSNASLTTTVKNQ